MLINHPTITGNGIVRPTYIEVDLSRLTHNYHAIQQAVAPASVMPHPQSQRLWTRSGESRPAYGFSRRTLSRSCFSGRGDIVAREGHQHTHFWYWVAYWIIRFPSFLEHDLTLTASSIEKLQQTNDAARAMGKTAKVHLKIDTGMERIGVHYYSATGLLEAALACDYCQIEGIYSHFANSDAADLHSSQVQLARFQLGARVF